MSVEYENLDIGASPYSGLQVISFVRDYGSQFDSVKLAGSWRMIPATSPFP